MKILLLAGLFLSLISAVEAQAITRCREAQGHAFYFKHGGWTTDAITGYELLLIVGEDPDIIYKDVTGGITSLSATANLMFLPSAADFYVALAVHADGTVEHYTFELDDTGRGTVVAGVIRTTGMPKSSIMSSVCESP